MILLDTNVISEVLKPEPSEKVLQWLASQPEGSLFTTAITEAEMLYGIELLPAGKRRDKLSLALRAIFSDDFDGRVLPFDSGDSPWFAKIVAARKAKGKAIAQLDAMIAAIATSRDCAVATRNVTDFAHCGVRVVNPWND